MSEQGEPGPHAVNGGDAPPVLPLNYRRRAALGDINKASFSGFHVKISFVTGIGFFTDAYDIFAITIAVNMLGIVLNPDGQALPSWQSAGLKVATPIGNLIGQLLFGFLGDVLGRKRMYGVELIIMIVATFAQAVSGSGPYLNLIGILIFWRVIMGIGVGGDYPLSAILTSEFSPIQIRGRMMTAVFSFQGWGQLAASLVGLVVVSAFKDAITISPDKVDITWRLLIGLGCVPAAFVLYFRLTVPKSPRFTMDIRGNIAQAERDTGIGLQNGFVIRDDDVINEELVLVPRASWHDFVAHFSKWKNFKVLFGTAYSWFVLDISFYILTLEYDYILGLNKRPILPNNSPDNAYGNLYYLCVISVILAVAGLIPGFFATFRFIDVWGRKPIQLMGFIILTILFWIMGFDYDNLVSGNPHAFTALYCLANFFQNFGPNTTTFIIPGEAFPTRYRSTVYGISAACGKLGAVIALIVFTVLGSQSGGVAIFWKVLSFVMMTGVFSTLLIPETMGRTLEDLSNEDQNNFIMDPV